MTRFASAGYLASWAGVCPGNDQSAGKRRAGRTRKGSKVAAPDTGRVGQGRRAQLERLGHTIVLQEAA